MSEDLGLERAYGADIERHVPQLAQLRMTVFRDWPYLYEGDLDYEAKYLQWYINTPRSFALLVYDGDALVGATTAMPLADEAAAMQRPFRDAGFDVERVFYNAESILLPAYRGRGLYRRFFDEREAHARRFGEYDWITHCVVQRPQDHPMRPADYTPLDDIWRHFGYEPRADLIAVYPWRDVGDTEETQKPLMFWIKRL
ncbi:MAG: GNAT family N-acetyltransferase [Proteobacteria bacterium SW_6_67_9]|nr:MAG: GNAT family N-acetyltransferase [Proteobacteria bacterium SW_6_67_9]